MVSSNFLLFSLFLLTALDHVSAQNPRQSGKKSASDIIRNMTRHASTMTPPGDGSGPLNVSVSMYVSAIHGINEESMDLTVDMYLRTRFVDDRLRYENGPQFVVLNPVAAGKLLWLPDLFVVNSKSSVLHTTLGHNAGVKVRGNGDVMSSSRHSFTLHCIMALRQFPFDEQTCEILLESYMYSAADMNLKWVDDGFGVATQVNPVTFSLLDSDYYQKIQTISTGEYQQLGAKFRLRRISTHYVAMVIVPTWLLVALTTLLPWLPLGALAERTTFGGFLFLSTVLFAGIAQIGTPQVGYMKKLDGWVLSCLLWEALIMAQSIVLHLAKMQSAAGGHKEAIEMDHMSDDTTRHDMAHLTPGPKTTFQLHDCLSKVDWVFRFLFPVAFVIFSLCFFLV